MLFLNQAEAIAAENYTLFRFPGPALYDFTIQA